MTSSQPRQRNGTVACIQSATHMVWIIPRGTSGRKRAASYWMDIGGFYGGDITDPPFRELIVRWFQ